MQEFSKNLVNELKYPQESYHVFQTSKLFL